MYMERQIDIMLGTITAVAYMHDHQIMHRDIKPENILLNEVFQPLVSDFGLTRYIADDNLKTEPMAGSPAYMAPEILLEYGEYSQHSDVFAFCKTFQQVFLRSIEGPHADVDSLEDLKHKMAAGGHQEAMPDVKQCPKRLTNLLRWGLTWTSTERPSAGLIKDVITEFKDEINLMMTL